MRRANEFTPLTDDLAAHWAEPVLEMVTAVARVHVSIDLEVGAWRIVKKILESELKSQQQAVLVSLTGLMERVLRRSAEHILLRSNPTALTPASRTMLRRLAGDRRSTEFERELYARIIRAPELRLAFKPPSRSDYTPRLRVSPALA